VPTKTVVVGCQMLELRGRKGGSDRWVIGVQRLKVR